MSSLSRYLAELEAILGHLDAKAKREIIFWAAAITLFVIGPQRLKAIGLAGGIGALIAADAIARWRYALSRNRPAPFHKLILLALFLLGQRW